MSNNSLHVLSQEQSRLTSSVHLITSQKVKQEKLVKHISKNSQMLICELRHLALIREKVVDRKPRTIEKILNSQAFCGLNMSPLQYNLSFFDPNSTNHFTFLLLHTRRNPKVLAKILYDYSCQNPSKIQKISYSLFLSLFQQGWSQEEDELLFQVLKEMAILQFKQNKNVEISLQTEARKLKYSNRDPIVASSKYEPFISFAVSYLFNAASFSYFQSSLAPIIIHLHSLSQLRDLRTTFQATYEGIAPFDYWEQILHYAIEVCNSLYQCLELMPRGVFKLCHFLYEFGVDLYLVFFEAFINRALDNPSLLGLLPWHPSHQNWEPAHDIADVLRTKYIASLQSNSFRFLKRILSKFPSYNDLNLVKIINRLVSDEMIDSFMICETEILQTYTSFPKEILITGTDLILFKQIVTNSSELFNEQIGKIISKLSTIPPKTKKANQHFYISVSRTKNNLLEDKKLIPVSIFPDEQEPQNNIMKDPYIQQLCGVFVEYPPFQKIIDLLNVKTTEELFNDLLLLLPMYISPNFVIQTELILKFAIDKIKNSDEEIIDKIIQEANKNDKLTYKLIDKTSSMRTQNQKIKSALEIVHDIRKNVQSHLLLEIAEIFMSDTMCDSIKEAMTKAHEFVNDSNILKEVMTQILSIATNKLLEMTVNEDGIQKISRILYFRLTEHITFRRFTLNKSSENIWKHSVIVTKIIEKHRNEIIENVTKEQNESFFSKIKYLQRCSDLLGHIRPNSGISVIVHYVLEMTANVSNLCINCPGLNCDVCLLWVVLNTNAKHVFLLSKFLQQFVLKCGFINELFTEKEISQISLFTTSIFMLLSECKKYDQRIDQKWA